MDLMFKKLQRGILQMKKKFALVSKLSLVFFVLSLFWGCNPSADVSLSEQQMSSSLAEESSHMNAGMVGTIEDNVQENGSITVIPVELSSSIDVLDLTKKGLKASFSMENDDVILNESNYPFLWEYYLSNRTYQEMQAANNAAPVLAVAEYDLNDDGLKDYIVKFLTGSGTKATTYYIHIQTEKDIYEASEFVGGVGDLGILHSTTNGMHDIAFLVDLNGMDYYNTAWLFDGSAYGTARQQVEAMVSYPALEVTEAWTNNERYFLRIPEVRFKNNTEEAKSFYYFVKAGNSTLEDAYQNVFATDGSGSLVQFTIESGAEATIPVLFSVNLKQLPEFNEKIDVRWQLDFFIDDFYIIIC